MVKVYHVDWTKVAEQPKARLWVATDEGKRLPPVVVDLPVSPYFFANAEEAKRLPPGSAALEPGFIGPDGAPAVRVVVDSPDLIQDLSAFLGEDKSFEADVPYARRVLMDSGLELSLPSYIHVDIETDPSGGVPDEKLAEKRILSIAAKDDRGKEFFFCDEDESKMISQFLLLVDRYPVVATFNGNHFDWPYLVNRCKRLGIEYWWDAHIHVDLLAVYKFVLQVRQDRYALGYLAEKEELSVRKRTIDISKLLWYFINDRDTLREYNLDDVRVTFELDHKRHMVEIVFNIANISHVPVKDLLRVHEESHKEYNTSAAVDGMVLGLSAQQSPRVLWRTKKYDKEKKCEICGEKIPSVRRGKRRISPTACPACHTPVDDDYSGALVISPIPGVHRNVIMLDVHSLYPTIIRSFNIGPETFRPDGSGDIRSPVGRGTFVSTPKSIFSRALEQVMAVRAEYKKAMKALDPSTQAWKEAFSMDYAYKVLANAFYGVIGSKFGRYYNKDVAENITLTGQNALQFFKQSLEGLGMVVVLGDTDSVAFWVQDELFTVSFAEEIAHRLTDMAKDHFQELSGVRPDLLRLEPDKLCSSMFIPKSEKTGGTKKRYAALVTWDGVPTFHQMVKGFEAARHDSSDAQKDFQKQGLMIRLAGDESGASGFLEDWRQRLLKGELDERIVIYKSLGKAPDEYKVMTPFLRVGKQLEADGRAVLHRGDKIAYIKFGSKPENVVGVLPGENPVLTPEMYEYIWEAQFLRIAGRLGLVPEGLSSSAPKEKTHDESA